MKKIANKVALQTVLYVISGLQKIRVVDRDNDWKKSGTVIFEGKYNDWPVREQLNKWMYASVHGIEIDGDTLVFQIITKYEQY